jgi:hypothetical protein
MKIQPPSEKLQPVAEPDGLFGLLEFYILTARFYNPNFGYHTLNFER